MEHLLGVIGGYVWGLPLMILLVGTGVWLTLLLKGIQFTKLPYALYQAFIVRKEEGAEGDISHFQALMTALSATVGTGNIAGVATAICVGGPGALFWMWMTGLVGMATKYAEAVLAVKYRVVEPDGSISGGPMYYLSNGLKMKWLGALFAIFASIACFGIGSMVQSNSVAEAVFNSYGLETAHTGMILIIFTAGVILGGIKSIARVTSVLVPVMIFVYSIASIIILVMYAGELPAAFALVIDCAFTPTAATGGFAGAGVMLAIRMGVARGLFSNESGLGSAPIAAAAAQTNSPVMQALVSMTQTFIDTLIVCTMTGMVIIVTGAWDSGANGAVLTSNAYNIALSSFGPNLGGQIITICIILFAYSTILGWCYYGEKSISYLLGSKAIMPFRWVFVSSVGLGTVLKLDVVWTISDIFNGMMAFPNLVGLILLSPVVAAETKKFLASQKK